jgi:hypothetical protein
MRIQGRKKRIYIGDRISANNQRTCTMVKQTGVEGSEDSLRSLRRIHETRTYHATRRKPGLYDRNCTYIRTASNEEGAGTAHSGYCQSGTEISIYRFDDENEKSKLLGSFYGLCLLSIYLPLSLEKNIILSRYNLLCLNSHKCLPLEYCMEVMRLEIQLQFLSYLIWFVSSMLMSGFKPILCHCSATARPLLGHCSNVTAQDRTFAKKVLIT